MKKITLVLAICALLLSAFSFQGAGVFYLSTTGNDANTGSSSAPFRTFPKALSVLKPGDTLIVSGSWAGTTWAVDGTPEQPITIRGNGATFTGPLTLSGANWLIVEGFKFEKAVNQVTLLDSHFITLRGNVFDYVTRGILIQEYSSHLLIEGNEFYQTCAAGKTWTQLKGSNCEGGAVYGSSYGGGSYYIRDNHVHDSFNGFLFSDDTAGQWMNSNVFIYNNRFERIVDDPVEPEGDSFNFHVYGNTMIDTHRLASVTTSGVGPVLIYNNVQITKGNPTNEASRLNSGFKVDLSGGYTNGVYIFNNTIVGNEAANFFGYDMLANKVNKPLTVRNNVYMLSKNVFSSKPTGVGTYDYDISNTPLVVAEVNGLQVNPQLDPNGMLLQTSPGIGRSIQVSIPAWFFSAIVIPAGSNAGAFQSNLPAPLWVTPPNYPARIPANHPSFPDAGAPVTITPGTPLPVTATRTPTAIPSITPVPVTRTPTALPTVCVPAYKVCLVPMP